MTTAIKKAYVKDVTLSFGQLSVVGSVFTPKKALANADEQFKMACPLHPDDPHGVKQRYVCADDPGDSFEPSACLKARVVDEQYVIVDAEAAKAAKKSDLEPKHLALTPHPYDPMTTFASGSAYVFTPADLASGVYAALLELVDERGVIDTADGPRMLVGLVALRSGTEMFARLERWGSQLIIRELIRPSDVDNFESIDTDVSTKVLDMARELVAVTTEEFSPDTYRSTIRERIVALAGEGGDGTVPEAYKPKEKEDLAALLEASLAAARS